MTQQIWLLFAHRSGSAPGIDMHWLWESKHSQNNWTADSSVSTDALISSLLSGWENELCERKLEYNGILCGQSSERVTYRCDESSTYVFAGVTVSHRAGFVKEITLLCSSQVAKQLSPNQMSRQLWKWSGSRTQSMRIAVEGHFVFK